MEILAPKDEDPGPVRRKFMAEAGLHLFSGGASVLRPCDLYQHQKNEKIREALEGCNIYVIGRRRRISVCPHSLRVSGGLLYGNFRLHGDEFTYEEFPFSQKHHLFDDEGAQWNFIDAATPNVFGHDVVVADQLYRKANIPAHVLIANSRHSLGRNTNLEVLYIGQGYGQTGKRLAIDRLSKHSTLQRILAESAEQNPHDEILLLMFRYEHSNNIISTAGDFSVEPTASQEEEVQHLMKVRDIRLDRKTRITLAEAALINHFKPKYNIMHKDSFRTENSKKLKTLKKLFSLDLTGLIVEINTANFGSQLFSTHAPAPTPEESFSSEVLGRLQSPEWRRETGISAAEAQQYITEMTHAHYPRFALYSPTERETFLHALPWGES